MHTCATTTRTYWGKGIYFARDASYSDLGWVRRAPDGTKRVLLSLVITGMSCLGEQDMQLTTQYRDVACHAS